MLNRRVTMVGTSVKPSPSAPVKTCEYSPSESAIMMFTAISDWKR